MSCLEVKIESPQKARIDRRNLGKQCISIELRKEESFIFGVIGEKQGLNSWEEGAGSQT